MILSGWATRQSSWGCGPTVDPRVTCLKPLITAALLLLLFSSSANCDPLKLLTRLIPQYNWTLWKWIRLSCLNQNKYWCAVNYFSYEFTALEQFRSNFLEMFIRTRVQIEGLLSHYGADINAIPWWIRSDWSKLPPQHFPPPRRSFDRDFTHRWGRCFLFALSPKSLQVMNGNEFF